MAGIKVAISAFKGLIEVSAYVNHSSTTYLSNYARECLYYYIITLLLLTNLVLNLPP